jgi:hypothetical protein
MIKRDQVLYGPLARVRQHPHAWASQQGECATRITRQALDLRYRVPRVHHRRRRARHPDEPLLLPERHHRASTHRSAPGTLFSFAIFHLHALDKLLLNYLLMGDTVTAYCFFVKVPLTVIVNCRHHPSAFKVGYRISAMKAEFDGAEQVSKVREFIAFRITKAFFPIPLQ